VDPTLDTNKTGGDVTARGGDHPAGDAEEEATIGMTVGPSDELSVRACLPPSECS
jgi:hypothetical protein